MAYFSSVATLLFLLLISSGQVLAAACPASSSAETSGASDGTNCTVTDGTTNTVIQLNFISGFDSATLIENDTTTQTATDAYLSSFTATVSDNATMPAIAAAASKTSGNNGTTLGAQRKLAFIKAAEILASQVVTTEPILVDADFTNTLTCAQNGATLGSASASSFLQNASAPAGAQDSTWYPVGLYNALDGADNYPPAGPLNPNPNTVDNGGALNADSDVFARYNTLTGTTGCLDISNGWYYGFDTPPSAVAVDDNGDPLPFNLGNGVIEITYIGFITVLLHEMLHGLGFSTLTDSSGNELGGIDDIYATFLRDNSNSRNWNDASESAADRVASSISSNGLLWTGTNVNTQAIGLLTAGFQDNTASAGTFDSGDRVQLYAPNPFESGSSVAHFDTAVSPDEIMEPQYTEGSLDIGLALYLLQDIGWNIATANTAPTITIPGTPYSTNEDTAKVIDASGWDSDAEGDTVTFSVSSCPAKITCSIDSDGQNLTLTPASNYNGATNSVEITLTDDGTGNLTASDTFNLNVIAQNDAPDWSAISTQNVTIGGSSIDVNLATYASDIENDSLTYSEISCGTGLSCSLSSTTMTLSGISNAGATVTVEVQADDGNSGQTNKTFSVNINAAANSAPSWTVIPTQNHTVGDAASINLNSYATDSDGDTMSYSGCESTSICSITSNTLTINTASVASENIVIQADDSNGGTTNSVSFTINIVAANSAPSWATIPAQNHTVGDTASINLNDYATDSDGDTMSYTGCESTSICSITSNTLTINTASVASENIVIQADDSNGGTTNSASFTINIVAANSAPSWATIPTQNHTVGDTASINLNDYATDSNGDTMIYSGCASTSICSISSNTLTINTAAVASESIVIQADDSNGGTTNSASFTINIVADNSAPSWATIPAQNHTVGDTSSINLNDYATDSNGDTMIYTGCESTSICSIISNTLTINTAAVASETIVIQADDSNGGTTNSASFTISISSGLPSTHVDVDDTLFNHGDSLNLNLDDGQIDVLGGSGDYAYGLEFNDTDVSTLITSNASGIDIGLPQSGAFAGTYTLTITDNSNGEVTTLSIIRPLRLTFSSEKLLNSDTSQTLKIEGGQVGSQYLVEELASSLLIFNDAANQLQTTFIATNDADNFNQALVLLGSETVTQLTTIDINVSSLNADYEDEIRSIDLIPAIEHRFTVIDTSGNAIALASANIVAHVNLTQLNIQSTFTSDSNGQFSLWLPDDDQFYGLNISANGFNSSDLTLAASLVEHEITLTGMSNAILLSGSLSALGTQDFTRDNPLMSLHFSDGSSETMVVSINNASQASFNHEVDLNLHSLSTMRIEQVDSLSIEIDMSLITQNQSYNILLERNVAIVISSPAPKESSGAGPIDGRFILLLVLLCLMGRRKNNRRFFVS